MKKIKLMVNKVDGNQFYLKDELSDKQYSFQITFFDLVEKVKAGDYVFFDEDLLNENYIEYSPIYLFGNLENPSGRKIEDKFHSDLIAIEKKGNERTYLKRIFG